MYSLMEEPGGCEDFWQQKLIGVAAVGWPYAA